MGSVALLGEWRTSREMMLALIAIEGGGAGEVLGIVVGIVEAAIWFNANIAIAAASIPNRSPPVVLQFTDHLPYPFHLPNMII